MLKKKLNIFDVLLRRQKTLYNTLILSSGFSGKTRFAKHSYQTVAFGVQPLGNSLYLHVYG